MSNNVDFRRDVAGLRAVAVLSVLLYHYGVSAMPGGFVGVDVFFVISGYLITKSIADDIGRNGHSIGPLLFRFYNSRIRRIVPALAAVLAATLAASWFLLMPGDYAATGESALYSAIGAGNLYFFWHTGYFDREAELQPLLNMWSLGVEEQFYLIWPIGLAALLWAARGRRIIVAGCIALLVVAGLAYGIRTAASDPAAAFYLPHPRAWELGVGALLAFLPAVRWRAVSELMGIVGMALIGWSVLTLVGTEASPGWPMLPAVLGAALLTWPRAKSWTARLLGLGPLKFVGDISYSLYLIHWPLLVLFRHYENGAMPSPADAAILAISAVGLSYLSWRYIEQPVRTNRTFWNGRRLAGILLPATGAVVCCAAVVVFLQGLPGRLPAAAQTLLAFEFAYAEPYQEGRCFLLQEQDFSEYDAAGCLPSGRRRAILWGDSFAAHYYPGLATELGKRGIDLGQISQSACRPIVGIERERVHCKDFAELALAAILREKPELVILSAFWPTDAGAMDQIEKTIDRLAEAGVRTAILGQGPRYRRPVPEILAGRVMRGDDSTTSGQDIVRNVYTVDQRMKLHFAEKTTYVSVLEAVCSQAGCPLVEKGAPVHWDQGHLTREGSALFAGKVAPILLDRTRSPSGLSDLPRGEPLLSDKRT